ncbi:hypothetical protein V2J09_021495 [Rumex salicifolius]
MGILLDDVCDKTLVNQLKLETIFNYDKNGSKVLVTTQSTKVVECLGSLKSSCFDLKGLFQESVFGKSKVSKHYELDPVGKKIMRWCGNIPLAIIVIGSLLRSKLRYVRLCLNFLENELGKINSQLVAMIRLMRLLKLFLCLATLISI